MKHGSRILSIGLMALLFALSGLAAVLLTERFGWRVDLTEQALYTLSEESEAILGALDRPVTITVINGEKEYPLLPANLLKKYAAACRQLTLRWCDPYLKPGTVRAYEEKGCSVELNDIVVESDDRIKRIQLTDLYEMNGDGTEITGLKAEQAISSAIFQVTQAESETVLFTDGHGEQVSGALLDVMEENHFSTAYTTLSVLGIQADASLLCIASPERDFLKEEIEILRAYMNRGGRMMVFLSGGAEKLTNLSAFLDEWGVKPGEGILEEPTLYMNENPNAIAATYVSHEINRYFTRKRYYVIVPSCIPLEQTYISQGKSKTQQVLRTSSRASAVLNDGERNANAPFGVAISSVRESILDGKTAQSRLIAIGSKQIYADDLMALPNLANRDFLVQCIGWCTEKDEMISIPGKPIGDPFLPVVAGEIQIWMILFVVLLPACLLGVGLMRHIYRRRL